MIRILLALLIMQATIGSSFYLGDQNRDSQNNSGSVDEYVDHSGRIPRSPAAWFKCPWYKRPCSRNSDSEKYRSASYYLSMSDDDW